MRSLHNSLFEASRSRRARNDTGMAWANPRPGILGFMARRQGEAGFSGESTRAEGNTGQWSEFTFVSTLLRSGPLVTSELHGRLRLTCQKLACRIFGVGVHVRTRLREQ